VQENDMHGFGPTTFGELYAEDYDALHDPGTTNESVSVLASLAGNGRVLELAIGTGRLALPLAARGLSISGIEGSPAMIAKLREKPGGDAIPVVIGDFADVAIEGEFDLVFVAFNTLFNLTSQEAQVRCFQNVAKRLTDGGVFVIETFVPDLTQFTNGQRIQASHLSMGSLVLEAALHDPIAQTIDYQRARITSAGIRLAPLRMRYAWPSEIDLMARHAGLELRERWDGWSQGPFTAASRAHVSVYAQGRHAEGGTSL
jgi:SAM-dependent methyltransferase